jgi:hypothetical protein
MKFRYYLGLLAIMFVCVACPNDDDDDFEVVLADRGEQSIIDDALILEYLQTHFYNYEDFENPPANFDFRIVFDTIAGDNSDRLSIFEVGMATGALIDTVYNRTGADQTLYKLVVRQGVGERPSSIADSLFMNLQGTLLEGEVFENSENPLWFDLTATVDGFSQGLGNLGNVRGASGFTQNPDGTIEFNNDYEIGALFIPSGLGFFAAPPSVNIPAFSPLIFTYDVFQIEESDHDNDGIRTLLEDVDNNGFFFDEVDNTDGDPLINFLDIDDDNDRVLTEFEIVTSISIVTNANGEEEEIEVFESFLDTDGDGVFNHLDTDDDGDGINTDDEVSVNSGTGAVTFTDTDGDGIPDYLDADS